MYRAIIIMLLAVAMLIPTPASAAPEGCAAVNPGQTSCTFTVASAATVGEGSGAVGVGTWKVVVKRGKKTVKTIKSCASPCEPTTYTFKVGDKVTASALSPGSWVVAGHG